MTRATRRWSTHLPVILASLVASAIPLSAAQDTGVGNGGSADRVRAGDTLHEQFRPLEALAEFQAILEGEPRHHDALWRAARETVSLGMLAMEAERAREWYREGETYARRAVEADPRRPEGHEWLAIALGRRALEEGPRNRVQMAEEIRSAAHAILAMDPDNPGGLHVLGRWNAEIMRLSGVSRFMARRLLGGESFDEASWDEAQSLLERATALAPERLIHHFDLARIYLDRDDRERARSALREVMERPAIDPVDPLLKQQAMELIRTL
jgi:tetratricopeptide (TPR) repeat protein